MKGVVFTEFLGMVEESFSADMVDDLIEATNPASQGAYTSVGTYPHEEIVAMVVELSRRSGSSVPELLESFGMHLFDRFSTLYPYLFPDARTSFDLLETVEAVVHVEVLKLYPDAELPGLVATRHDAGHLSLDYRSPRGMEDLAVGLIRGCGRHFGETLEITTVPAQAGVLIDVRRV